MAYTVRWMITRGHIRFAALFLTAVVESLAAFNFVVGLPESSAFHNAVEGVGVAPEVRWMLAVSFGAVAVMAMDAAKRNSRCLPVALFHGASTLTFERGNLVGLCLHATLAICVMV
eukprot:m.182623 g.182623  ORF g.182623 m.182623 type:complete len:116 (+) comp14979_c0_seq1:1614-1961(+)